MRRKFLSLIQTGRSNGIVNGVPIRIRLSWNSNIETSGRRGSSNLTVEATCFSLSPLRRTFQNATVLTDINSLEQSSGVLICFGNKQVWLSARTVYVILKSTCRIRFCAYPPSVTVMGLAGSAGYNTSSFKTPCQVLIQVLRGFSQAFHQVYSF